MGYTNSPLTEHVQLSPNCTRNRSHAIDTVTIHCMAGNLSVQSCGSWFANPSARASSNYGIDSQGRIALYVAESDRSWCSSNSANDDRAITIEVANTMSSEPYPCSDMAYASLIKLLVDICQRNGIAKLIWSDSKDDRVHHRRGCNMTVHRDFANKSCPGQWLYDRQAQIAAEVNARLNGEEDSEEEEDKWALVYGAPKAFEVVTASDPLNCRHEPGSAGAIVGSFPKGEVLTGDAEASISGSKWVHVTNGQTEGWCSAAYLKEVEPAAPRAETEDEDVQSVAAILEHMTDGQAAVIGDMDQRYRSKLPESEWAVGELDEAVELGITDGTRPKAFATREEVAIMIKRAVKLLGGGTT